MRVLRYCLVAAIALILQSTLLKLVSVRHIQPDVVLLVLFYIGLMEGSFGATIAGFCTGLVQDVYAPQTLGLNALCKSLVGFALGYCQRGVFMESLAARALILFSTVLVHDILYFQISLWPEVSEALALAVRVGFPTALYTALLGYVIFYLMGRKEKIRPLQESL